MFPAARRIDPLAAGARARILICKKAPAEAVDQEWTWGGRSASIDAVGTLAEGLALCMHEPVDRLIVNMFSFTASELTALAFFREMHPFQHLVAVCREDVASMLLESDLADECHTVRLPGSARNRAHRART